MHSVALLALLISAAAAASSRGTQLRDVWLGHSYSLDFGRPTSIIFRVLPRSDKPYDLKGARPKYAEQYAFAAYGYNRWYEFGDDGYLHEVPIPADGGHIQLYENGTLWFQKVTSADLNSPYYDFLELDDDKRFSVLAHNTYIVQDWVAQSVQMNPSTRDILARERAQIVYADQHRNNSHWIRFEAPDATDSMAFVAARRRSNKGWQYAFPIHGMRYWTGQNGQLKDGYPQLETMQFRTDGLLHFHTLTPLDYGKYQGLYRHPYCEGAEAAQLRSCNTDLTQYLTAFVLQDASKKFVPHYPTQQGPIPVAQPTYYAPPPPPPSTPALAPIASTEPLYYYPNW